MAVAKNPPSPRPTPQVEKPKPKRAGPDVAVQPQASLEGAPPWMGALRLAMAPPPGPPDLSSVTSAGSSYDAIVADAVQPRLGQLTRADFIDRIERLVKAAADEELAPIGRNADNCPYLQSWVDFYRSQPPERIERAIKLYTHVPAGDADALLEAVTERVRGGLRRWRETGDLGAIPAESPLQEPPRGQPISRLAAGAGGAHDADPATVLAALGTGRPLDPPLRGRMEGAFGASFSGVRVHDDASGASVASAVDATAFTVGEHVGFAPGAYRPDTLAGEAVIAHEMAHVRQQKAGVGRHSRALESTAEEDANRSAAGAMAGLRPGVRGRLGSLAASPALRTGLALQRCSRESLTALQVTVDLGISPEDQAMLDEFEGLEETVYPLYQTWQLLLNTGTATAALGAISPEAAGTSLGMIPAQNKAQRELESALAAEGQKPDAFAFSARTHQFEDFFERYAKNAAFKMLEENEALVQGELDRYSGDPNAGGVADLKKALAPYQAKIDEAKTERKAAEPRMVHGRGGVLTVPALGAEQHRARAKALEDEVRKVLIARFPIAADPELDLVGVGTDTNQGAQAILLRDANARISNIRESRASIDKDPSLIWQFEGAVERAKLMLNIVPGSIFDQMIEDRIRRNKIEDLFKNLLIAALAIGLGLLSAGTGTVAVLGATGAAALSIGMAASHVSQYLTEAAAYGSAFDRAKALSMQEPSVFWLALDIAFAAIDAGMAVKAFRALAPVAEGVKTAEDVAKLKGAAKSFAQTSGDAELAKNADQFANQIEQAAKQHLSREQVIATAEKADQAAVAAVRAVAKDEVAVAGLLRVGSGTRTTLLTTFKEQPAILERLGRLIETSPQTAGTVEKLVAGMPDQFKIVISKYMLTRNLKAPNILRALADAGVTEADFKAFVGSLGKTKSAKSVGEKFATFALETIADRLPSGAEGIKRLRAATAGLQQAQSGTIFERWATKNIYGKTGSERFVSDTKSLADKFKDAQPPPSFHDTKVAADDMRTLAPGKAAIVEYKHYLEAGKFGDEAVAQIKDYGELVRLGVKNDKGEVLTTVEYLFSSKEAAVKNEKVIRDVLGARGTIKYVADDGTAVVLAAGGT